MTVWTSLLEALHSAMVDELNELFPNMKPELGMPLRMKQFAIPDASLKTVLAFDVRIDSQRGTVFLGMSPKLTSASQITAQNLWNSLHSRAEKEFERRGIAPQFGGSKLIAEQDVSALPKDIAFPRRMVWIPFTLPTGICYLGFGPQE